MIHIIRPPAPDGFSDRSQHWNEQYAVESRHNPSLTISQFWSHIRPEIRADATALKNSFHDKCAFCESKISHVSNPQVEHYRPKSTFPNLTFTWDNWLISCGRCNENKWSHFPQCDGSPCLINPLEDEPSLHIDFVESFAIEITERGKKTIDLIGLARSPLEEERSRWLDRIKQLLLLATIPQFRQIAREYLIWALQPEAPYTAMTRSYLLDKTPRLVNPIIPHPHVDLADGVVRINQLIDDNLEILQELE